MKTFKQFLSENDPLNDTSIEMWLRHRFKLLQHEAEQLRDTLEAQEDWVMSDELYAKLVDGYADEIPYDVVKGDADESADVWLMNHITNELRAAGLELE